MKILCTGSCGFIGTTFCEYFHEKHEIVGIDWKPPREKFLGVKYYQVDILNIHELRKVFDKECPSRIVHFAALPGIKANRVNPIGAFRINVIGTINLIEMAKVMNLEQFIYISSDIIYGKADKYPCTEVQSLKPDNPYAASKAASDILTQNALGVSRAVARPAMEFGPRSNPGEQVVARFIWNVIHDKPLHFPAERNISHPTRDINYVGNLMYCLELMIDKEAKGVYNIGSGNETSILELAEVIVEVIGKGKIVFDPNFRYRRGEEGIRTWLDISKAKRELGYQPRISLQKGLEITYEWMLNHLDYWD